MGNKKSIFSQIRTGYSYLTSSGLDKTQPFRLKALQQLEDFVYSGSYTKYRNKSLFLDLESKDDSVIAKQLQMSVAGVRQARKRVSEDAFKVLGFDVVDRILYNDAHACELVMDNLNLLRSSSSDAEFVLYEVKERLVNSYIGDGTSSFNLLDCKNEMLFLSLFTVNRFSDLVSKLDSEKINYLLRLLDGDVDNIEDRFIALKYIASNRNLSALADLLKEDTTSN